MKSNVLKIGLPLGVIAFGLASAASTSSLSATDRAFAQNGYQRTTANPTPCDYVRQCDENGNFACTVSDSGIGKQLYDEETCLIPLKRSTP
ncbi:DUF6520 family protein [Flavobacterium sp. CSZ]|uniref:DUF6520 family protein n=1 Tax=Flavobacterium sp. CSZ TaxID=2783791 RepID=UPI00188BD172|nr:DUF6520 family protein [Flavobacterium sp. CSZ]MBF4485793.1 hypothetical protein [Flavobacterium sp. CSZ]